MLAHELLREGRLGEAIASLNAELREAPTDVRRRTFLFELLCFAGDYDRASKLLDTLVNQDPEATTGILAYRTLLECTRERVEMFTAGAFPNVGEAPRPVRGRLNGRPFELLEDADPRIGARLEVFMAGQYHWLPFEHLASVKISEPTRLRDLFWITAEISGGEALQGSDLGEALIPALTPHAFRHPDELVRLGRATAWDELTDGIQVPLGQKMLVVDEEDFPILEVRELEIDGPSS